MKYALLGTISHGTMRAEDLIPTFVEALSDLQNRNLYTSAGDELVLTRINARVTDVLAAVEQNQARLGDDYWDSEDAEEDLLALDEALSLFAPKNAYFGAHPGDGSDFGFWPHEPEDTRDDRPVGYDD